MALPSSGQLNTLNVYYERWGVGNNPSGSYTLEQLQADWNLPETPDDTDIFYGKGRAGFNVSNAVVSGTDITVDWSITNGTGFSGTGDIEFRFYYRTSPSGTKNYDSGWFSRAYNSTDSGTYTYSGLNADTDYWVGCDIQLANWSGLTYDDEYFQSVTTEQDPPTNVSFVQDGDFGDLTWSDPNSGTPANGFEYYMGNDSVNSTTGYSASSTVCGDEVPEGDTGNVSGHVRAVGDNSTSDYVSDSDNFDCTTFCLVQGTKVTLLDGSKKAIEDLEEGDVILGADIEGLEDTNELHELFKWRSDKLSKKSAVSTIAKNETVTDRTAMSINNGMLKGTGAHTHLIKRDGEWRFLPLRMVKEGDLFYKEDGSTVEVESVEKINEKHVVQRLTLEQPFHTFFANGMLTHNVK